MSKTLTLPDELYKSLEEKSKERGMKPEQYALELLKNETQIGLSEKASKASTNSYQIKWWSIYD